MEKHFHKEFKQCPACGSEDRFFEQLCNELKIKGWAREEFHFHLEMSKGVVLDKTREATIPIGSEVPGYGIMTDICINCGCLYATELIRNDVKKSADVSRLIPPRGKGPPRQPFSTS